MTDVYIAILPKEEPLGALSVTERQNEIGRVSNERVRREKFYVWKLLEAALEKSLGLSCDGLDFYKDKNGKWHCSACNFSLSHSHDALAVAVSDGDVGIDVELMKIKRPERASGYILTPTELEEYRGLPDGSEEEYLVAKWCQKEAAFKLLGGDVYKPSAIELDEFCFDTRRIELENGKYILAVATRMREDIRLFEEEFGR